jgi:hypothetical protein
MEPVEDRQLIEQLAKPQELGGECEKTCTALVTLHPKTVYGPLGGGVFPDQHRRVSDDERIPGVGERYIAQPDRRVLNGVLFAAALGYALL